MKMKPKCQEIHREEDLYTEAAQDRFSDSVNGE